jgi:hypothetical protein
LSSARRASVLRPRPFRIAATALCALTAAAGSHGTENRDLPPNARGIVIANKTLLWSNTNSIRNSSIAPLQRQAGVWQVCVRMTATGPLGKPTQRDFLVALPGGGNPPSLLMTDATAACASQSYAPFPELDGKYELPVESKRGPGRK